MPVINYKNMDKDTIKRLIIEYQQFVANITLIEREIHLSHQLNYVFVGLRRAGKSYLMYQQIQSLLNDEHQPEEILYFNFEDDRLVNLTVEDLDLIKVSYEELYPHKPIFFLDEIQIVWSIGRNLHAVWPTNSIAFILPAAMPKC